MGFLNKISSKIDNLNNGGGSSRTGGQADSTFPPGPEPQPPNPTLIPRYRKQRGVNLGSWFVLEGWMAPASVFREAAKPKQSDLDVAKGGNAKMILEEHWDQWITDEDWGWIKEHGYNSVRIPVSALLSRQEGGRD
jgi:glucan 1,3-beta-glucosidase